MKDTKSTVMYNHSCNLGICS